jgi:hypothetical protein
MMFSAPLLFLSLLGKFEPIFSLAAYMEEVLRFCSYQGLMKM